MKKIIFITILAVLLVSLNLFTQQKLQQTDDKKKVKQEKVKQKKVYEEKQQNEIPPKKSLVDQNTKVERNNSVIKIENQKKRKPIDFSQYIHKSENQKSQQDINYSQLKPKKYKKHVHKPYSPHNLNQHIHYSNPINYFYTISPEYIYRGLWVRYHFMHADGFYFWDGYPYFVYNNYVHRYSSVDPGSYDLVDSITDKVYATFYGNSLKQSYDRCADLRDRLNNDEGFYRYFCAERFEYDQDYDYGWDPDDYPDWYWY
jgi:hypothetical protein